MCFMPSSLTVVEKWHFADFTKQINSQLSTGKLLLVFCSVIRFLVYCSHVYCPELLMCQNNWTQQTVYSLPKLRLSTLPTLLIGSRFKEEL